MCGLVPSINGVEVGVRGMKIGKLEGGGINGTKGLCSVAGPFGSPEMNCSAANGGCVMVCSASVAECRS